MPIWNWGLWLGGTLLIYILALLIFKRAKQSPLAHPLITSVIMMAVILALLNVPIEQYQQEVTLLTWLLGPATVALAVPLRNQLPYLRQHGWHILPTIAAGGVTAPLVAWGLFYLFDIDHVIRLSVLTRSITTPLAIEVSVFIGGYASMAAVFVVITGIIGVIISDLVFGLTKVVAAEHRGLVLGTIAHAIGTASGFLKGEKVGAYATLALCINGILTALILPFLFILLK